MNLTAIEVRVLPRGDSPCFPEAENVCTVAVNKVAIVEGATAEGKTALLLMADDGKHPICFWITAGMFNMLKCALDGAQKRFEGAARAKN